ncbi:hypothetical protein KP79_PYT19037 [Mizuhopecten yessoensis]|uniref:Uncharacterized protein n=1 Tax=Mizuhopecten yessoensis TaxID=6573 RepID=A0A210PVK9_MIZYE|nr:hypothetical protein KP79_PYT19037 [Mizuhopecten yessoensis]
MKATARNPRLDQRFTLLESERRFRRACEQIVQLNYKLDELQSRYLGVKRDGYEPFATTTDFDCRLSKASGTCTTTMPTRRLKTYPD